ncbi:MAG: hypothetical protein V4456_07695 [Bacteroidota bacterium]
MSPTKRYIIFFLFLFLITGLSFQRAAAQADTAIFKRTPLVKLVSRREGLADQTAELLMQVLKIHDSRKITLVVQSGQGSSFLVDSTHVTAISFADSNRVELKTTFTVRSSFGGMGFGCFVSLDFDLTDEQYQILKEGEVTKIDVAYSEGVFSFDLNEPAAALFKETAAQIN